MEENGNKVIWKGPKLGIVVGIIIIICSVVLGICMFKKSAIVENEDNADKSNYSQSDNKKAETTKNDIDKEEIIEDKDAEEPEKEVEETNKEDIVEAKKEDNGNYTEMSNLIMNELKTRKFLADKNLDNDCNIKYVEINSNGVPCYIVEIELKPIVNNTRYEYLAVTCEDGKVKFSTILEHKYEFDLSYDVDSLVIKTEALYKERILTMYGKVENGEYKELDSYTRDYPEEENKVIEEETTKYGDKDFISFENNSKILEN